MALWPKEMKKPSMLVVGIFGGLLLLAVVFAYCYSRWEYGPGFPLIRMMLFFPEMSGAWVIDFVSNGRLYFGSVAGLFMCFLALMLTMSSGNRGPRIAALVVLAVIGVSAACCVGQRALVRLHLPLWCNVSQLESAQSDSASAEQFLEKADLDPNTPTATRRRLWFQYKEARTRLVNWGAHVKEHGHIHFR